MKYAFIGLAILFMSCAALGSKTKVYNENKIRDVKTVGLVTKRFDQPRNPHHKIIKESFTKAMIEGLEKKNLFKVVVLDTMENEKMNIKTYETNSLIDAVLFAEWKLASPYSRATDCKVQLSLVDKKTKEVLLFSRHGTKLGNSYWLVPPLPGPLLDATEGALNALEKSMKSKR